MVEGKRTRLSATEKNDIWGRWKAGQSMHEIGRAFGKSHSSIRCQARLTNRGDMAHPVNSITFVLT